MNLRKLASTILIAVSLFILDALVLNQGVIVAIAAILVLAWSVARLLHGREDKEAARIMAWKIAIYAATAGAVFGANYLNNHIARDRTDRLIQACRQFEAVHHRLPDKLEQLVPDYISEIPPAKYTLNSMTNRFYYLSFPEGHQLFYVEFPPFDRPTYYFETDRWELVD